MSGREELLNRIRTALGDGAHPAGAVPRAYRSAGEHTPGSVALLDLLTDRLEDYKATVHRCTPGDLPSVVARALEHRGVLRLVVPPGLDPAWTATWTAGRDRARVPDEPAAPLSVQALDETDGVLTACTVAIAETGTFVLDGSPDQGRRAVSLVPDYHLVVIHAPQVVQTVPEALPRLDPRRPLTWVSGPSATSDIELSRVEGVHGPRTLEVVLVEAPA